MGLQGSGAELSGDCTVHARQVLERTLGLRADLRGFYRLAGRDARLQALAQRFRGMRPPCFPTVFEAVMNAIACQQLSLTVGIHLLNRLTQRYGPAISAPGRGLPGFPTSQRLANADPSALHELGFSRAKASAVTALAQQMATGSLDLEALRGAGDGRALAVLAGLTGVGRWSAEYTLLRGARPVPRAPRRRRRARNNLRRRFGLAGEGGNDAVAELSRAWWPYAGLVYFQLLLDTLAAGGLLVPRCHRPERWPGPCRRLGALTRRSQLPLAGCPGADQKITRRRDAAMAANLQREARALSYPAWPPGPATA